MKLKLSLAALAAAGLVACGSGPKPTTVPAQPSNVSVERAAPSQKPLERAVQLEEAVQCPTNAVVVSGLHADGDLYSVGTQGNVVYQQRCSSPRGTQCNGTWEKAQTITTLDSPRNMCSSVAVFDFYNDGQGAARPDILAVNAHGVYAILNQHRRGGNRLVNWGRTHAGDKLGFDPKGTPVITNYGVQNGKVFLDLDQKGVPTPEVQYEDNDPEKGIIPHSGFRPFRLTFKLSR